MNDFKETERILKALANRRRLAILRFLKNKGEQSVSQIAKEINLSFKSTSKHMNVLLSSNIVDKEQKGLQMFYHLIFNPKGIIKQIIYYL